VNNGLGNALQKLRRNVWRRENERIGFYNVTLIAAAEGPPTAINSSWLDKPYQGLCHLLCRDPHWWRIECDELQGWEHSDREFAE